MIHVLCKTYKWQREYVLSLTESEIYQHLYEIRKDSIDEAINNYLMRGQIAELLRLDDADPIKRTYLKRRAEIKEEEKETDKVVLKNFMDSLEKQGYIIPGKKH